MLIRIYFSGKESRLIFNLRQMLSKQYDRKCPDLDRQRVQVGRVHLRIKDTAVD